MIWSIDWNHWLILENRVVGQILIVRQVLIILVVLLVLGEEIYTLIVVGEKIP
jgi:hypothetical protein